MFPGLSCLKLRCFAQKPALPWKTVKIVMHLEVQWNRGSGILSSISIPALDPGVLRLHRIGVMLLDVGPELRTPAPPGS